MNVDYVTWPKADRDALGALFDEARASGKWFWCRYQDLWFAPDDLEARQRNGTFRWGAVNWELRDPREKIAEARKRANDAVAEAELVAAQVANSGSKP